MTLVGTTEFDSTSSVSAPTLAFPAGIQAGDVVLLKWSFGDATVTGNNPTSHTFTQIGNQADGNLTSRVLKRICTGTEGGQAITGWSTSALNRQTAVCIAYRGYSDVSGIVPRAETVTGTTHDCPAISTTDGAANGDRVVIFGADRAGSTGPIGAPAGYTVRATGVNSGTGGTTAVVADRGEVAETMPVDPAAFTGFLSSGTAVTWTVTLRPTVASGTMNFSTAPSTQIAQALAVAKSLTYGVAPSTQTALGWLTSKAPALSVALSTQTAHALAPSKVAGLTNALATDQGRVWTVAKALPLAVATETDSAVAQAATKATALLYAAESDQARLASTSKASGLTTAGEADAARVVGVSEVAPLSPGVETDQARPVGSSKLIVFGVATETSTAPTGALNVAGVVTLPLGRALETDAAGPWGAGKAPTYNPAPEADAARAVSHAKVLLLGVATETATVQAATLSPAGVVQLVLSRATEAGTAGPLAPGKLLPFGTVTESSPAWPGVFGKTRIYERSIETGTTRVVALAKLRTLQLAAELDSPRVWATPPDVVYVPAGRPVASTRNRGGRAATRAPDSSAATRNLGTSAESRPDRSSARTRE